ncbi:hypothetical protein E1B28_010465 [Marasmius oreades]|uniref:F-box domain-containing protein n=1 Tax=Marasmius oreades TaxID=181124 RepID=A0A9P7UTN6_9AGAR|nr:uncharacterized protein E1B28_010465 [Marasmius oreades]KAG7091429.1 hypothetical protein E1B28_010465 [Marasmius oreades]
MARMTVGERPDSPLNLLPPSSLDLSSPFTGNPRGQQNFYSPGVGIIQDLTASTAEQLALQDEQEMWTGRTLYTLPYDLLLNITSYLDFDDIHALHLTCKSLYYSTTTRPVYRKLAADLLRRCRPLPLKGFQRLMDLPSAQLIMSVNKAHHYERAWRNRGPHPATGRRNTGIRNSNNHYLDNMEKDDSARRPSWYRILQSPPYEEVDWLSPITSSYILCATKTGKVVCWDVQTDRCLAEWVPGEKWELWKCRVEFDEKVVYFTMAKVLNGSYDDTRLMHFSLMRLSFIDSERSNDPSSSNPPPSFSHVTSFRTTGVVMNIFLLDPSARLLSAFIWVSESNTIGLYVLLDWEREEYVFVDTGIECVISSNWSCILYANNIVIHCEDSDSAFQHFYPLSHLEGHVQKIKRGRGSIPSTSGTPHDVGDSMPVISGRLRPWESIVKRFKFSQPPNLDKTALVRSHHTAAPTSDSMQEVIFVNESEVVGSAVEPGVDTQSETIPPDSASSSTSVEAGHHFTNSSPSALSAPTVLESLSHLFWGSTYNQTTTPPPPTSSVDTSTINPFPFPPWYPESAHFVRQWWPSLPAFVNSHAHYKRRDRDDDGSDDDSYTRYSSPHSISRSHSSFGVNAGSSSGDMSGLSGALSPTFGPGGVPRVSCTVVLLASHDQLTHRTKFILMQHYFRVPMRGVDWVELRQRGRRLPGLAAAAAAAAATAAMGTGAPTTSVDLGLGDGIFSVNNNNNTNTGTNGGPVNGHTTNGVADANDDGSPSASGGNTPVVPPPVPATTTTTGGGLGFAGNDADFRNVPLELYMIDEPPDGSVVMEAYNRDRLLAGLDTPPSSAVPTAEDEPGHSSSRRRKRRGSAKGKEKEVEEEEDPMNIWYVAEPFEVVCVLDSPTSDDEEDNDVPDGDGPGSDDDGDDNGVGPGGPGGFGAGVGGALGENEGGHERPRPLVAVDFGHAVWIEYVPDEEQPHHEGKRAGHEHEVGNEENEPVFNWTTVRHERASNGIGSESDPKRLRFVTFPPYVDIYDHDREIIQQTMGEVRTLEVPPELDLNNVETINIDQSQGAVILSVKSGQIFILCYE